MFVAALKIDLYQEQHSLSKKDFFLHLTTDKNRLCSRSNLANDVCLVQKWLKPNYCLCNFCPGAGEARRIARRTEASQGWQSLFERFQGERPWIQANLSSYEHTIEDETRVSMERSCAFLCRGYSVSCVCVHPCELQLSFHVFSKVPPRENKKTQAAKTKNLVRKAVFMKSYGTVRWDLRLRETIGIFVVGSFLYLTFHSCSDRVFYLIRLFWCDYHCQLQVFERTWEAGLFLFRNKTYSIFCIQSRHFNRQAS